MEIDESTTMETDEHITMPPPSSTDPVSSTEINGYELSCQIPPLKRKRDEDPTTEEPMVKKPKTSGKCDRKKTKCQKSDKDSQTSILVRAYSRRGDDAHIGEAKIGLDFNGGLVIERIAEKLQAKGTLRIIYPRNRYLYDPLSRVVVCREEIEEMQDADGVLLVTFSQNYSRPRAKRPIIEFL